jgi:2'-5' RNA ligase
MKPDYIKLNLHSQYDILLEIEAIGKYIKDNSEFEFCPVEINGLHMTICFLGFSLKSKKLDGKISEMISSFPFEKYKDKNLIFEKYDLFPEDKKNLIVAKYKAPKEFTDDVINFQKKFADKPFEIINDKYYFTPHITMGKIMYKNNNTKMKLNDIPNIEQQIKINSFVLEKQN